MNKSSKEQSTASGPTDALDPPHDQPPELKTVSIKTIKIDRRLQPRERIDKDTVKEYAEAMLRGDQFPPLVCFYDGANLWLAEGFHRAAAYKRAKIEEVQILVYVGDRRRAQLHAAGSNTTHGIRRTNADKQRAVKMLLDDSEWQQWNNSEIARRCGVDDKTVAKARKSKQVGNSDSSPLKFVTKSGKTSHRRPQKTRKPQPHGQTYHPGTDTAAQDATSNPQTDTASSESAGLAEPANGFEDFADPAAAAATTAAAADSAEAIVLRATEANEAVLALGDTLASVPIVVRNRLGNALRDLAATWRRLFPTKVTSNTVTAASALQIQENA